MSYPLQYFRIAIGDTDNNVVVSGSSLAPSHHTGKTHEKWYLNYKSANVFQIVNVSNNQVLTGNGNNVSVENNSNSSYQYWKIEGVQKDYDGYFLYYKITNNADSTKSLTYTSNKGFSLTNYSGANYQKFKINLDGLEGFAANCQTSSGEKAGTIGGLFGPVVEVTTADQLEKELNSVGPQTIVVNGNIDMKNKSNTRIRDNKTIVGSFKYHTILNCQLRTNDAWGAENDNPSDNIILRNLDMQNKDKSTILVNIWSSRQIWIDHINFISYLSYDRKGNGQDEVGKFIWLNTPYENYMDKKDRLRSPDYMTISYCKFSNRYWTVAYGTQNDEITRDRTTLMYNFWYQNVRRCPQLGNGSAHVYNSYYQAYGQKDNGSATTGIIGGDGSNMVSQNNMFNGYTKSQALNMGTTTKDPARDDNSYFSTDLNGTPTKINFSAKKNSSWNPNNSNYGYRLLDGYNTKNTDTKTFCTKYAGCFGSQNDIKYITDSDFSKWVTTIYDAPFIKHIDFSDSSSSGSSGPFKDGSKYKIKNVNSGLYMQVESAKAENGANVQQWGTTEDSTTDIWKLIDKGDGYYCLLPGVGDEKSFALHVAGNSTDEGANIEIYQYDGDISQQFLITMNSDGSYIIKTRITNNQQALKIESASKESGGNVQQWNINGTANQNWIFEPITGDSMKTDVIYEFENLNSGAILEIASAKMEDDANVQQWTTGHQKHQQWKLKSAGNNYYYIHSVNNENFVLKTTSNMNGGNICISTFVENDNSMLFKFIENGDGTYSIYSKCSNDKCVIEVLNASKDNGQNIQHWQFTDNNCQKWKANIISDITLSISNTKVYKEKDCIHTVIFVK